MQLGLLASVSQGVGQLWQNQRHIYRLLVGSFNIFGHGVNSTHWLVSWPYQVVGSGRLGRFVSNEDMLSLEIIK